MHLPSVCEGTFSNLHISLVENSIEGGDHIEGGHHFCSLLWVRALLQALHACFCHQSQRGTSQGKGEKTLKPRGPQSCKKTLVKNLPPGPVLPAYSARSPYHVNHSICRLLFQKITMKNLESQKNCCFSWVCSFPPCTAAAPGSWPHCTEQADYTIQICILFCFLFHYYIIQLQYYKKKRATALQVI